jgi:predicted ribonuclease YlaK
MEEQNNIHLTHCFLDTNVFLHFQRFDTVDWPEILSVQQVYLMLTTTVMEELNHHKDDAKNPGRQKRAKEILSRLEKILPTTTAGVAVPLSKSGTFVAEERRCRCATCDCGEARHGGGRGRESIASDVGE